MEAIMSAAGFTNIQVVTEETEFVYASEEAWWATQWSHATRGSLEKLERTAGPDALQKFKADAFEKMRGVRQPDGFHQLVSALLTVATKP
jgi:hypothetical protein